MEPTYTTYDPMALRYAGDGLLTDRYGNDFGERAPIPHPDMVISNPGDPRRMARMRGYRGFGQMETTYVDPTTLPVVYASEDVAVSPLVATEPSWLDSLGNTLGNIIRTVGQQAPGVITGYPTAGQTYPGMYPTTQPTNMMPLLLIGGGLLVFYLMSGKKR